MRFSIAASALVVVVVASLVFPPADAQPQRFVVTQGEDCVPITPVGDGLRSVESFYDYRSPDTEPTGGYSSYGTMDIQRSQTSQLFVYRGREGLSLVFLHDEFGDGGGGAVLTADLSGLPASGEWVVEDDTYNGRDDVFDHRGESSHIEWLSNGNRTDGAVFRGLGRLNGPITVDMTFNEQTENYPFEGWESPPERNEIEQWVVRSGTGELTELDMDEPIEIDRGTCNEGTPVTATPDNATTTQHTELNASSATGDTASEAFGPGFGVGLALVAIVGLAVLALGRSNG